ncbi:MAG TPA: hypothetical protein PKL67_04695, partial [Anaerolineae bacterium]|nr:hypothetical protein [Anaerolineae bacterium]
RGDYSTDAGEGQCVQPIASNSKYGDCQTGVEASAGFARSTRIVQTRLKPRLRPYLELLAHRWASIGALADAEKLGTLAGKMID